MRYDYGPLKATAERLIHRFGMAATLETAGAATGDPWNPTPGAVTQTEVQVVQGFERLRDAAGTLVGRTLHTLTISTSAGVVPQKADRIQVDGQWVEIDEVRPVSPGGTDLLYEVDVSG